MSNATADVIAVYSGKAINLTKIIESMDAVSMYIVGFMPSYLKCPVFNMQIGHMVMYPKPTLMMATVDTDIPEQIRRLATVIKYHDNTLGGVRVATEEGMNEMVSAMAAKNSDRERREADVDLSNKRPILAARELAGGPLSWGFMGWVPVTDSKPTPETDTSLSNDRRFMCLLYDETIELLPAVSHGQPWISPAGVPVIAWARAPQVDFYGLLDEYRRVTIRPKGPEAEA